MAMPKCVRIVEVGPRDGLQNEPVPFSTAQKIELIDRLGASGLRNIEVGSFVSPKWIPLMADTANVIAGIRPLCGVTHSVLVPNIKGLQAAREAGVREIAVFASASESFSQRNINCSIGESLERFLPVVSEAREAGIKVRGYVSCILGCPYEGEVAASAVASIAEQLAAMGCYEISLGDTIGVGTPKAARRTVATVAEKVPVEQIALHFHDTWGQALANLYACLDLGVGVIDSAVAGLGGCPYANGASGNVATEDVVYMLDGLAITTGVDLASVVSAGVFASRILRKASTSKVSKAFQANASSAVAC